MDILEREIGGRERKFRVEEEEVRGRRTGTAVKNLDYNL